MTFPKRKPGLTFRTLLILCILLLGGVMYVNVTSFFSFSHTTQLTGVWGRLQEKIPQHHEIQRQEYISISGANNLQTTTQANFTIHPSLFDTQRASGSNLLSGIIYLTSEWNDNTTQQLHLSLSGTIAGMSNDTTKVTLSFAGDATLLQKDAGWYVYLENIRIDQAGKQLASLVMRDLLLHRYSETWIYVEDLAQLEFFNPKLITNTIETNAQKVRLLPTEDETGHFYSISGDNLQLTGTWTDEINYTYTMHLPESKLVSNIKSSHVPQISNIEIIQNNDYAGTFEGAIEYMYKKNSASKLITGEVLFPGGIWISGEHSRTINEQKKTNTISLPEKYIERKDVMKGFRDIKKQDNSIN